ncbi:glycerophosphodiester phosphodiesterase family protein [Pseudooceanicola sp.]|uniref:glycerophosphodiester phosphodiesterase family protein n=1 Tax=Pseudooceanicola sp. TaxID=1914328 RepID=UPI00262E7031|nr:glycerophosphodiester phosphodiesterase family protein [Pseudooceanicola sp.]MDF1856154.1 glycerophosphodiester phosphodiesterase family protein [Pseudooceanicola sp.]
MPKRPMQVPPLPTAFLQAPIAHRALHDRSQGRPENSREAIAAAMAAGYGIEIDLQLSADGAAMVFHDYALERLTGQTGAIRQSRAAELGQITLTGGASPIPRFTEVLALVAGRVPLLVEIKDQDGALGPGIGQLEAAAARDAAGYGGPLAFMSFNPHSVRVLSGLAPDIPRGIVTSAYRPKDWMLVPAATRVRLRGIPDIDGAGAAFISHEAEDLARPRVAEIRARGLPVLCWTIRSPEQEAEARKYADNVTFEGYAAALSG